MLPPATLDLYRSLRRRAAATAVLMDREWVTIGDDFDAGWQRVGPRLTTLLAASQVGAATDGAAMVPVALAQSGHPLPAAARVVPSSLAGYASDGRGLQSLLYGAVVNARTVQADSLAERLSAGSRFLSLATRVQVSDAARGASAVAIAATPGAGWVRYVNPPCCQDCAVLAGKWFAHNQGFARHKGCDCVHRPAAESEAPSGYVQDVPLDQIKDLTQGQRAALDDGADLGRVVNAYRSEVPGRRARMTTTAELSDRGGARLTPDGILARSQSRDESVALLRQYGYLT